MVSACPTETPTGTRTTISTAAVIRDQRRRGTCGFQVRRRGGRGVPWRPEVTLGRDSVVISRQPAVGGLATRSPFNFGQHCQRCVLRDWSTRGRLRPHERTVRVCGLGRASLRRGRGLIGSPFFYTRRAGPLMPG